MNTKGNQRAVETENKIKFAFLQLTEEKAVNKITVSEICSKAEIHRTTFYVHFLDVADLMQKMTEEMYAQIMEIFAGKRDGLRNNGFEQLFEMIRDGQQFYAAYLNAVGGLHMDYDLMPEPLQKNLDKVMKLMGHNTREEVEYHQVFFCAGLSAIIMKWLNGGCKESPEFMAGLLVQEYNPGKRAVFQKP